MDHVRNLFFNHADAWCVALAISAAAAVLHGAFAPVALLVCAAVAYSYWLGFAVNDYFDADADTREPRKRARNFFAAVRVGEGAAVAAFSLLVVPLVALVPLVGGGGVALGALGVAAMLLYSMPPFRLKSRPPFDLLVHAFFVQTFPYAATLALLGLPVQPFDAALLTVFFLSSLSAQLEQQVRDHATDAAHGDRTTVVVVGSGTGAALVKGTTALTMAAALAAYVGGMIPAALVPFGVVALPVFAHRFVRPAGAERPRWLTRLALAGMLGYTLVLVAGALHG